MSEAYEESGPSSWVLKPITEIRGVRHALTMTLDGMVQATSENLTKDEADGIGAMTAALHSASRAATNAVLGAPPSTPLTTVTSHNDRGTYMVMPVGEGTNTLIAAAGDQDMPMGVVAATMARQAMKLGEQIMSVPARVNDGVS
ncbi:MULTISPECIES: roadblock/LC7 domain-containing protein [unclassified Streptomyces]|uniref:roadblock/LC7 domain-containing protein n=1 Tax=unclassified Streptomyces TaxID=2593676 RepID=UPI00224CDFB6|nr:roadblock/LC7 domain-containing protein [Streptomyces sp. NBC_00893]MCX4851587.1 roadblock/LC7 domain-containing protein [Streptomyces sp. NBC_00893]